MLKLSIIIPAYNEEPTIKSLVSKVLAVELPGIEKEVIVIDDCSKDDTNIIASSFGGVRVLKNDSNRGKGYSVRQGFSAATGDLLIIQDADLEYDPADYAQMLKPLIDGQADIVFGSRFLGHMPHRVLYFWHYIGNKFLTTMSNIFTNLNLTDMEVCYKAFNRPAIDYMKTRLRSDRFGIEPELAAYAAKGEWRVYEVGVSYYGRTYREGKKIGWKDGLAAIYFILRYNLFNIRY